MGMLYLSSSVNTEISLGSDGVMPNIEGILKLISDYGVSILIVGIFLYVIIRIINIFIQQLERHLDNKKHDKLLNLRTTVDEKIQKVLDVFLESHVGNRVQVIEFSNSVLSVAYLPFQYMTCSYEVYKMGTFAKGYRVDRLSTSLFTQFFELLRKNDVYEVPSDADPDVIGGAMHDLISSYGNVNSLFTALYTSRGKILGYIHFMKSTEITDKDIEDIQTIRDQIAALLGVVDN